MRVVSFAAAAILVVLTVYVMVTGRSILVPLVTAVFAAHLIAAVAAFTRRIRVFGRPLAWTIRAGASLVILYLLAWLGVQLLVSNSSQLIAAAPIYENNLRTLATQAGGWLGLDPAALLDGPFERGRLTSLLRSIAISVTGTLGGFGTVVIFTVFLLLEQHSVEKKLVALVPDPQRQATVRGILDQVESDVQTYILLKAVLSAATTILSYAVMKAVGLHLAEFWAVLIFFLNFIPYVGAWSGVIFPALLATMQFDTLRPIVLTIGLLTMVQFTGGTIIEPRVMGTRLNLSPLVVLLSLAAWGSIWGVAGMFLAVPMMVVLMIVCAAFPGTRPIAILLSADGRRPEAPDRLPASVP
jgi:predicted PurR-regulated permease PerM